MISGVWDERDEYQDPNYHNSRASRRVDWADRRDCSLFPDDLDPVFAALTEATNVAQQLAGNDYLQGL